MPRVLRPTGRTGAQRGTIPIPRNAGRGRWFDIPMNTTMNIEHAKKTDGLGEDSDADIHGDH